MGIWGKVVIVATVMILTMAGCTQEEPKSESKEMAQLQNTIESNQNRMDREARQEEIDTTEQEVVNNGEQFVQVKNRIYYREYGQDALTTKIIGTRFIDDVTFDGNSTMMYYDTIAHTSNVAFEDNGYGPIYYSENTFFLNGYDENKKECVYSVEIDGSNKTIIGTGKIVEMSPEGNFYAVSVTKEDGNSKLDIYGTKTGKLFEIMQENDLQIVEFTEDRFIYQATTETEIRVYCIEISDNHLKDRILLGSIPVDKEDFMGITMFEQALIYNDTIYLGYGVYEGTGQFFAKGTVVSANLTKENSMKVEKEIKPNNEDALYMPVFYLNEENELVYTQNEYAGHVYENNSDLYYVDDTLKTICVKQGILPCYEGRIGYDAIELNKIEDSIYFIRQKRINDPANNLGWRSAYQLMQMEYVKVSITNGTEEILGTQKYPIDGFYATVWVCKEKSENGKEQMIYQLCEPGPQGLYDSTSYEEVAYLTPISDDFVYSDYGVLDDKSDLDIVNGEMDDLKMMFDEKDYVTPIKCEDGSYEVPEQGYIPGYIVLTEDGTEIKSFTRVLERKED